MFSLYFPCFREGVSAQTVIEANSGDQRVEGLEVFQLDIVEDPNFPNVTVFQNEFQLEIQDNGTILRVGPTM